jgi:hypothetical protein
LITQMTFGKEYRSLSSSLHSFLHSAVTSSLVGPNIFSAFSSSPISLLANTKKFLCFSLQYVCFHPIYHHQQHKPKTDMYHLISSHPALPEPPLMAYSTANLKSNGNKPSPCYKPFLIGNMSDKCLPPGLCYRFHSDNFLLALPVPQGYQTQ